MNILKFLLRMETFGPPCMSGRQVDDERTVKECEDGKRKVTSQTAQHFGKTGCCRQIGLKKSQTKLRCHWEMCTVHAPAGTD